MPTHKDYADKLIGLISILGAIYVVTLIVVSFLEGTL
jgi:hypothetical protein